MSRSQILKIVAGLAGLVLLLDYMGTYQMSNEEKAFSFSAVLVAIGKWIMGRLTDSKKESKPAAPLSGSNSQINTVYGKLEANEEIQGDDNSNNSGNITKAQTIIYGNQTIFAPPEFTPPIIREKKN